MTSELNKDAVREIERFAAVRAEQDQIVEERPGQPGELYTPNTPWLRQDDTPRQVPEHDADGGPWRITGQGRHVGSHNGEDYCLEWLPVVPSTDPAPVPSPEAPPAAEAADEERREREARRQEPDRKTGPVLGVSHDDADREAL
jgi:hypothetical protein